MCKKLHMFVLKSKIIKDKGRKKKSFNKAKWQKKLKNTKKRTKLMPKWQKKDKKCSFYYQ